MVIADNVLVGMTRVKLVCHIALSRASSSSEFSDLKVSHRGLSSLWIFDAEIRALDQPFDYVFVGKFSNRRPPLDSIRMFIFNLKLIGDCFVTVLDAKHILIKLVNIIDYSRIFFPYFLFCFQLLHEII
ncbi:hypothetical protein M5K25_026053 [Dendrobium thyrsiflorum]|uniref:Uncharacterized protein n=1 Tax=Dendrobium thyrsiflorum TaxID=117978 RepID=A0ABD0TW87_DENTH